MVAVRNHQQGTQNRRAVGKLRENVRGVHAPILELQILRVRYGLRVERVRDDQRVTDAMIGIGRENAIDHDGVIAAGAIENVIAAAAREDIVAGVADQGVVADTARRVLDVVDEIEDEAAGAVVDDLTDHVLEDERRRCCSS